MVRLDKVEITGSAVRRIDAETALPVQVIRREAIERSGASNTADLLQALPVMQHFTNEGRSIAGGGLGFSGASIHNLDETRTLVLLNGRRLATFAGQYINGALAGIDLNTIPLAAIDRIEILTDGASSLYGADAIGGVINFITRRNFTSGDVTLGFSSPRGGGKEKHLSVSKGVGDLEGEGFNVLLAGSYDRRTVLQATDRSYSRSGVIDLDIGGRPAQFFAGSGASIPGNLVTADNNLVNPYYAANGVCPPGHITFAPTCYYDFAQQVDLLPERERGGIYLSGTRKVDTHLSLFAELLVSATRNTNHIAPPPGEFTVDSASPFWPTVQATNDWYWNTFAGAPVQPISDPAVVSYRLADLGKRTQTDRTDAQHLVLGGDGRVADWDVKLSYTHSINKQATRLGEGWAALTPLLAALNSGQFNPFLPPGQQTAAGMALLNDARATGFWEGGRSTLDMLETRVTRELMPMNGSAVSLALGASLARDQFEKSASLLAQNIGDQLFGNVGGIVPYTAKRNIWAAFGEVLVPVTSQVELAASLRHDQYSDFGGANTGKLSLRFQPTRGLLLRGSVGTGFKAPTVAQVNATRQSFGFTGSSYTCTPELAQIAAGLGAVCPAGDVQYNVFAEGNRELKAEKSNQWTMGFRVEPMESLSVGADLWSVRLKNAIDQVPEATVFGDPLAWQSSFTSYVDPGTNQRVLAFQRNVQNLGENIQRGIDFEATARWRTPLGPMRSQLALSYHLKDRFQSLPGGPFATSLGEFNSGDVTLRWQGKLMTTLEAGAFTHSLGINFKAGYKDQPYSEADCVAFYLDDFSCVALQAEVKRTITVDWQTQWRIDRAFLLTAGVLNVFNQEPRRSYRTQGGGQMIGYNDRYSDPRDRTLYASLSYKF